MGRIVIEEANENQAIECCRLVASLFVIFIHILLPNELGQIMDCLARFAVPFFFMISGYFAYHVSSKTILKRILRICKLNLFATLVYVVWGYGRERYLCNMSVFTYLARTFSMKKLAEWVFLNGNPAMDHLWYLTAITVCLLAYWIYIRLSGEKSANYSPLYIVSVVLFVFHVAFGVNAMAVGINVPTKLYRNALFFGMPIFSLGIFLHEYQEIIVNAFNLTTWKLIMLIAFGIVLSLLQWAGIEKAEMPVGMLLVVVALMLLLLANPHVFGGSRGAKCIISRLGRLSTGIYIMHPLWDLIYTLFCQQRMLVMFPNKEGYLHPFIIAAVSLIMGSLYEVILFLIGCVKKHFFAKNS